MNDQFSRWFDAIVKFLAIAVITLATQQVTAMQRSIDKLQESVTELNQKFAVVITERVSDKAQISDLEQRVRYLERRK